MSENFKQYNIKDARGYVYRIMSHKKFHKQSNKKLIKPNKITASIIVFDVALLIIIFVVSRLSRLPLLDSSFDMYNLELHKQQIDLLILHLGIISLIIPIAFLIVHKLRSRENKDDGEVLIKESYFWHIIFFSIALSFNLAIPLGNLYYWPLLIIHSLFMILVLISISSTPMTKLFTK